MKKPKFPKNKTEQSLKNYEQKLDQYNRVKALEARLRKKGSKIG